MIDDADKALREEVKRMMHEAECGNACEAEHDGLCVQIDAAVSVAVAMVREERSHYEEQLRVANDQDAAGTYLKRAEAAERDATTLLPADPKHDDCVIVLRSGINFIVGEKRAAEKELKRLAVDANEAIAALDRRSVEIEKALAEYRRKPCLNCGFVDSRCISLK